MGTTGGNRIADVLYSSDPRHYDSVDRVFALGFVLVVVGGVTLFWTDSLPVTLASLVGMFLALCVMVVCIGFEDLLGDKESRKEDDETNVSATEAFEGGDAFEGREGLRGRGKRRGPERRG